MVCIYLVILTSSNSGTLVFRDSVPPQYRYDIIICREVKGLIYSSHVVNNVVYVFCHVQFSAILIHYVAL